jgi:hypothetical protein
MKHNLTDRFLSTVKAPATGRLVVTDKTVRGLTVRVSGVRSFVVRYRLPKQKQRDIAIGIYPEMTLAEARHRARHIVAAAKRGVDLIAEEKRAQATRRQEEATARTVKQLAAEYMAHAKAHQRRWQDVETRLKNHVLPVLGDRPVKSIRRADIVELLDVMQAKGLRQQVNRVRSALSTMLDFAVEREYVDTNPVIGTKRRKLETERNRVLSDAELRAIWRALDKMPDPGRSFVKTLMLTGARRDEVRKLPWSEIGDNGIWVLPGARNKSARDFEIPLSTAMVELLAGLPKLGPQVFGLDGRRPWAGHSLFKKHLDRNSGIYGWTWHDIRRTVRSKLAELRVPYEVSERILNHAMTKIERTYNRHSYREEKAAALQLWADRLAVIVGRGRDAPNVVEIKRPAS